MLAAAAIGSGAIGLVMFAVGRRVDRVLRCRKCSYPKPDTADRCPECGRGLSRRFAVKAGLRRRNRLLLLGAVPLLLLGCIAAMFAAWDSPASQQPGWKLIADLYVGEDERRRGAADELASRFHGSSLPAWQQSAFLAWTMGIIAAPSGEAGWVEHEVAKSAVVRGLATVDQRERLIDRLVLALKDDGERYNGYHAVQHLTELGPLTFNPLFDALESQDRQQRQFASVVLGRIPGAPRTSRLYDIWVEGLADDGNWSSRTGVRNASAAIRRLMFEARSARPQLIGALRSPDPQQRYLSAYILGASGQSDLAPVVAPVLLPHLRDNDISGDAVGAAVALYRLGGAVEPFLTAALDEADEQQRSAIELILWDLDTPPVTSYDFDQRRELCKLSDRFRDPLVEMNPEWVRVPWFPRSGEQGD